METPTTGADLIRTMGKDKFSGLYAGATTYTEADDARVCDQIQPVAAFYGVKMTPQIVKSMRHEFGLKSFEKGAEPAPPAQTDLFAGAFPELAELRKIADSLTIIAADVRGIKEGLKPVNA